MITAPAPDYKRLIAIDRFTTLLVSEWRNRGATVAQINNELDNRILNCGRIIFNYYCVDPGSFNLSEFIYLTLKYCYGILKAANHLAPVNEIFYQYFRDEIKQWRITCRLPTRGGLTSCAMVLNLYGEVTQTGQPFKVK